jgi:hypothetical protein
LTLPCVAACALDVVFVLTTRQTTATAWSNMIDFAARVVSRMNIDSGSVQVGLVTYGFGATDRFFLNTSLTRAGVVSAIYALTTTVSLTSDAFLTNGLTQAYTSQFTAFRGDRPNVPNVVVVLSVANSDSNANTIFNQANIMKSAGITIYGFGINTASAFQMQSISSSPQLLNLNYFYANPDTTLGGYVNNFYNILCPLVCAGK